MSDATLVPAARPTLRDPALEAHFDLFGFAVVPFFSERDVAWLVERYSSLGPAPDDPRLSIYFDYQSGSAAYKQEVVEAVRPLFEERGAEHLFDHHLFYPEFIMKWPGHRSGFAPHIDVTFVEERVYHTTSTWCPLVDVTGVDGCDNGMVWLVPGSHKFAWWPQAYLPDFHYGGVERAVIEDWGVGIPLRAGEALIFDHRIVHFSLPNAASVPRLAIDGNWRPREAPMYHYRQVGDDTFERYAIDDDFFWHTNPISLKQGPPAGAPLVDTLTLPRPTVTEERLAAWCSAVPDALGFDVKRHALEWMDEDAGRGWYSMKNDNWRLRAVPYCASCRSEDDLEPSGRAALGQVSYLCAACRGTASGVQAFEAIGWQTAS